MMEGATSSMMACENVLALVKDPDDQHIHIGAQQQASFMQKSVSGLHWQAAGHGMA